MPDSAGETEFFGPLKLAFQVGRRIGSHIYPTVNLESWYRPLLQLCQHTFSSRTTQGTCQETEVSTSDIASDPTVDLKSRLWSPHRVSCSFYNGDLPQTLFTGTYSCGYLYLLIFTPTSLARFSNQSISSTGGGTISSGCFRTSFIACEGHVATQRPQPMHFSRMIE